MLYRLLAALSEEKQGGEACVALAGMRHFEELHISQDLSARNLWGLLPNFLTTSLLISEFDSASDCTCSTAFLPSASLKQREKKIYGVFLVFF